MKKYLIFLLFCFLLTGCGENQIKTVAPFSFLDLGDTLEIKGGWNYSGTKYKSTVIYCDKLLGICSDTTASLILDGHLYVEPMLWKVKSWGDIIIAESGTPHLFPDHFLYINRKSKEVIVFEKSKSGNPFDISDLDNLVAVERLRDIFYQRQY